MKEENIAKGHSHTMLQRAGRWIASHFLAALLSIVVVGNLQAAPFAYITNYNDGTVSVIDTATNTVTATVTVGGGPAGVAVHPNGTRVYITWQGTSSLSVIDTASNAVIATLPLGGPNVSGIAVSPDGTRVYAVANHYVYGVGTIAVIDTATNTVITTVTVGGGPNGIAVSPDSTRVYVANQYSGTVSVIDTTTTPNTVIATVTVGLGSGWPVADAIGVAVSPDGTRVYVTNRDSNTVSIIDTTTNTVTATVAVAGGPIGIAINPAGTRAYVTNIWASTVSVIDTTTNTVISTFPVGTWPYGVDVNPTGTRVYVANYSSNNVSVIDTATNTVVGTVAVGNTPVAFGKFITKDTTTPPDPTQQLSDLLAYVTGIGPGQSLAAKVRAAQTALAAGDTIAACGSLQALINEATAQSGKKLTAEQANHIIDAATEIRTQIGC